MRKFSFVIFLVTISSIVPGVLGQQWQARIIDPNLPRAATVDIGDIDGDKDMDVVATSFSAGKVVWYDHSLRSDQEWDLPYIIDDSLPGAWGVQIADIDNDTDLDVVAAGNDVHDVVWYKNEGGIPIQWTKYIIDDDVFSRVICVADIDNDKDADVIVSAIDGDRILFYENDNLTWLPPYTIGYLDGAVCLKLCDMDGDHDLDVVATSFLECKVFWFENDPPNHGWYRHAIDTFLPGAWGLDVADIDGDSDPDVAATGAFSDDVVWYENKEFGWHKHVIDEDLDDARYLSIVDVDMDKDPDLVVTGYDADIVVWYKNDLPDTAWTRNTIDGNLNGANYVLATHLDSDPYPDLIVTGWYANKVAWYENLVTGMRTISEKNSTSYSLLQNYPNPFNPTTNIEFSIPPVLMRSGKSEFVTLKVYNILGEEVATLVSERLTAGNYKYDWDASSLASGVYLYRIQAGNYVEAKKMALLR